MRTELCVALFVAIAWQVPARAQADPMPQVAPAIPRGDTAPQSASRPIPLTLAQAEALAVKNNPRITIAKLNALIAQQYVREARSALLPTASVNLTAVEANPGSRLTAGALNNPILFSRAASGAAVSQLITDFGHTTNLLKSSEERSKAEEMNSVATTAEITLAVDRAFFSVLDTNALVAVAEQTVSARQVFVDKIQALAKAKLKSDVDLSFAKVDLARAKLLLLEAQNNFQAALASLSAVLGYPDEQNFQLVEEAKEIAPPPADVERLITQAMGQRPEIAARQFELQAVTKNAAAEHDLWRPTISTIGVVGNTPVRDDHITPNWYGAVGININIPVFNGFLYNARAKAADVRTETDRQELMDLRNSIARDVRIAWQDTNRAYERLSVTKQLLEQASLGLDLAQQRYSLGLASIVEYSQAQLSKTEADIADTNARYQYRLSEILLDYETATPH